MKISEHFLLEEFVPKAIFQKWGDNSIWFVDPRIIDLAEFVRTFFNKPVVINNWHKGGKFNYRGFRDPECTVGGKLGQHRFGRGIDINILNISPQEVYKTILDNSEAFMKAGLTTLEDINDTPTWTHLDCRVTNMNTIKIVKA